MLELFLFVVVAALIATCIGVALGIFIIALAKWICDWTC